MKISQTLIMLAVSGVAIAISSEAQAINITSSGTWTSISGNPSGGVTGLNSSEIRWGIPEQSQPNNSGYLFDGANENIDDGDLLGGATFKIGTFTHENFTIQLPSITSASLNLNLNFGGQTSQNFSYNFNHNETRNNDPCPIGTNPCPDIVSIPDARSTQSVTLNGADFNLEILGFMTAPNTPIVNAFVTTEEQANSAMLFGRLTLVPGSPNPNPPPIPEPTTLLGSFLLTGLGIGLRKRQQSLKQKAEMAG